MPGARGGLKRASEPLEVEVQVVLSSLWVLGTEPRSFARAAAAEPSLQLPSPKAL